MIVNFATVLANLDPNALIRIMAATRNDADYYWATVLPERDLPSYNVEAGNITITGTMAGLVGMDSPYPEGGSVKVSEFLEKTGKMAIAIPLKEEVIRTLQQMVKEYSLQNNGAGAPDPESFLTDEALNFFELVVVQSLKDTREWLRGQALKGKIDWTFNKKRLLINYGFPAANILTPRTGADAYGGANSKFWEDMSAQNRRLRSSSKKVRVAHPDTVDTIIDNPANSLNVIEEADDGSYVIVQRVVGDNRTPTGNLRERMTLIRYGLEGSLIDPTKPGETIAVPFCDRGLIYCIGSGNVRAYRIGEGAQRDPRNDLELGYHHIAPTVEGDGQMGDFGRIYTPQDRQWELRGEGVSNNLPVVEGNKRVSLAQSEIPVI